MTRSFKTSSPTGLIIQARRKQGGYSHNTVVATFSVLKIWLNEATEAGLITTKDYRKYPSKGDDVDNIALTVDEIEAIYRLNIPKLISEGVIDTKSTIEATRRPFYSRLLDRSPSRRYCPYKRGSV